MDIVFSKVLELSKSIEDEIIGWRRDFHMYPELGYREKRTSRIVAGKLRDWGFKVIEGIAETGVVGLIKGGKPGDRTIALRADMDALPLEEENDVPYKSRVKGVMHACGHDAHVAMLLGAAKILSQIRDKIPGQVKLIFQPAEEGGNGAKRMVEEGVLEDPKVDVIYGIHVWSLLKSSVFGIREGPVLAATGDIHIEVIGKGGHGAYPHIAVDPIVAGSSIVLNLQTIISRNVDPLEAGVVSICAFNSGRAFNVIPGKAVLKGTYRALTYETLNVIRNRIREIVESTCKSYNVRCNIRVEDVTPPTVNEPKATKLALSVARRLVGEEAIVELKPTMGGEDFAYYLQKVPGVFIALGTGNPEKKTDIPHHNPKFDVDEEVLYLGTAFHVAVAYEYLSRGL